MDGCSADVWLHQTAEVVFVLASWKERLGPQHLTYSQTMRKVAF